MTYKEVFQLAQDKGMNHLQLLSSNHNLYDFIEGNDVNELLILTLIQKWLRDNHNVDIFFEATGAQIRQYMPTVDTPHTTKCLKWYSSYEDALLHGVAAALKLIP